MPVASRKIAPKPADDGPLYFHELALTPAELQVVLEAMRAGGLTTIDGFLRVAAAKLALHLNVRVPTDAFQLTRRFS